VLVGFVMLGSLGWIAGLSAAQVKTEGKEKAGQEFAMKASAAGMAEVNLSKLAMKKTQNAAVREFAQRMIADQTKVNSQLLEVANRQQIPLAKTMDEQHQKLFKELLQKNSAEFDHAYLDGMVKDHEQVIKLFEDEAKNGKNNTLKKLADKSLPTLKKHLEQAQNLSKKDKNKGKDKSDKRKDTSK
jgi:putative membrane protein